MNEKPSPREDLKLLADLIGEVTRISRIGIYPPCFLADEFLAEREGIHRSERREFLSFASFTVNLPELGADLGFRNDLRFGDDADARV